MSRYVKDELGIWHLSAGGDSETNFVGTTAQWEALTAVQKAQYLTVDLIDDYNGYLIDDVPVENSPNFVRSGGVYEATKRTIFTKEITSLAISNTWGSLYYATVSVDISSLGLTTTPKKLLAWYEGTSAILGPDFNASSSTSLVFNILRATSGTVTGTITVEIFE